MNLLDLLQDERDEARQENTQLKKHIAELEARVERIRDLRRWTANKISDVTGIDKSWGEPKWVAVSHLNAALKEVTK
jgi:hypothetical protein